MYTPNFTDPRVIKRIKTALGFACGVMSDSKSHPWSTRHIDRYFGMASRPLSKYLRKTLLIVTDEFYRYNSSENKCKEYRLDKEGVRTLRDKLNLNNILLYPSVTEVAKQDHIDELRSGNFVYKDTSNRLWHPLQRYRRQYKQQILSDAGYTHQYDIVCSAPTLIHQYAQQIPEVIVDGRWQQGPMDLYLFALRRYLSDRTAVRAELAQALELDPAAVKEIINALFAGAIISNNTQSDIYHILNGDRARIDYLKQNEFIQELIADIKTCWEYIRPVLQRRTKLTKSGKQRLCKITSRQKWNVYFELERVILDSVRSYLDDKSIKYFLEHDGWSCNTELDIEELKSYVKKQTSYEVNFEHLNLNNILLYPSVTEV